MYIFELYLGEIKVHPELSSGRILATIVAHCTGEFMQNSSAVREETNKMI